MFAVRVPQRQAAQVRSVFVCKVMVFLRVIQLFDCDLWPDMHAQLPFVSFALFERMDCHKPIRTPNACPKVVNGYAVDHFLLVDTIKIILCYLAEFLKI